MRFLAIMLLIMGSFLHATQLGVVKKIEGKAKVQHQKSLKKQDVTSNMEVEAGDTLLTYKGTKVVLELTDKTKIVLDEYATLKLMSQNSYEQSGGKIFFKVTKRKGSQGLKVKTPFAIIGVKGTEFVVSDDNATSEVSLNEGLIGVDSPDGKNFEHIDEDKVKAKLGNTPNEVNAEFEAYKAELYKEFAEYTSSFDLNPGKKLRFNGKQVLESSLEGSDRQQFKLYMSDAEFDAISKELEEELDATPQSAEDALDSDFFDDEQ